MGDDSKIRWTDATWNPVTGCSRVSPGCEHCYAETLSLRFGWSKFPWTANHAEDNVVLHKDRLKLPLTWRKPRRVFVNSMSDLFHEMVPDEFIDKMFAVMALTPWHTYQILTKRPERMLAYFQAVPEEEVGWLPRARASWGIREQLVDADSWLSEKLTEDQWDLVGDADRIDLPLPNVWLGTSVEDQRRADERVPLLLRTPAAVRFLSCEPLLGPVDLVRAVNKLDWLDPASLTPGGLDWVIVGGESGPKFRPMETEWARAIRDDCVRSGTAFFFKQSAGIRTEMGQELDGVRWEQFPT